MTHSPRHNVGSVAEPHWVVDEDHYLKAVADSDHFFACWQDTLEQRDKLVEALKLIEDHHNETEEWRNIAHEALKECGK